MSVTKLNIHVLINETKQSKATIPKDSFFLRGKKGATSGGIQTRDILRTRQTLYQLSHRGSSAGQAESLKFMQGKGRLSPDGQGNSISLMRSRLNHQSTYLHTE